VNGSEIALDTNQAIAVLNDTGEAGQWVQAFTRVYLPVPVVGELCFGALNSRHAAENLRRVEQLVLRCEVLEVKVTTAGVYRPLRRRGGDGVGAAGGAGA